MPDTPHIVRDVMTLPVVAVGRDAQFKEIVRAMGQWKVSAVPVLEGDGRVIGVVSEADLLPKEEFRDRDLPRSEQIQRLSDLAKAGAVTAEELMSTPAVTVHPDVTLAQAARIMAVKHLKRLPVVDDEDRLQGIVSRADLLKVFLRSDEDIEEEVRRTVVSYLFPALSHTIHVSVDDGVVTLRGRVQDTSLVWVAERLVRAVEGVVDVESRLSGADTAPDRPETAP
ncbi:MULTISPECIES: CBS domain-containing protein [unclassified Streptomyces]|uniref:CBS domain-containing protein n=1 Tax=unclassified Streptomyces TaxID=2593676 RepID=UPI002366858A|nr:MULTISPECIES: CBS domain-containing protein [unclassified Streptomyces]MDF3143643.1 CBS domain-containing protein [Streptomyces sp. T21Q-yed]WDF43876.1 CBS domain-containing protein [Streptomyces sp. T12]